MHPVLLGCESNELVWGGKRVRDTLVRACMPDTLVEVHKIQRIASWWPKVSMQEALRKMLRHITFFLASGGSLIRKQCYSYYFASIYSLLLELCKNQTANFQMLLRSIFLLPNPFEDVKEYLKGGQMKLLLTTTCFPHLSPVLMSALWLFGCKSIYFPT